MILLSLWIMKSHYLFNLLWRKSSNNLLPPHVSHTAKTTTTTTIIEVSQVKSQVLLMLEFGSFGCPLTRGYPWQQNHNHDIPELKHLLPPHFTCQQHILKLEFKFYSLIYIFFFNILLNIVWLYTCSKLFAWIHNVFISRIISLKT